MMTATSWESLVAETQFATELTLTGLRRLCSVPTGMDLFPWASKDMNYSLHVGMYSYSSGLERLCKLAIACSEYAATGEFPKLRSYSHRIGNLLAAVEALTPTGPAASIKARYLVRPSDGLDPDLINTVERFANGAGRYEHLDALWNTDTKISTYSDWSALAARASTSEEVRRLLTIREKTAHAIELELDNNGLAPISQRVIEDLSLPLYEASVGVALSLFRKARWVSTILDVATYYTRRELPLLHDVTSRIFNHSAVDFFNYHIARIGDEEAVAEHLQAVYRRTELQDRDGA